MLKRRGFLTGIGVTLAAPAIIRMPGLLMPVKALPRPPRMWFSEGKVLTAENLNGALDWYRWDHMHPDSVAHEAWLRSRAT